jgi:hypothetical protein
MYHAMREYSKKQVPTYIMNIGIAFTTIHRIPKPECHHVELSHGGNGKTMDAGVSGCTSGKKGENMKRKTSFLCRM